MSGMGTHEQITPQRDHLWVAVIIAACVLLEVWASWLGIGAVSGFPKLGNMTTGWILPVATEAYWSYALWAWLGGAPGSRSRKFAMWTAAGMFVLSLLGQESGHLLAASREAVPPVYVVAFVTALPLVSLALVAILVHLRQADREDTVRAARATAETARKAALERAETDERASLRAQLQAAQDALAVRENTARAAIEAAQAARTDAEERAARAEEKAARLTRKLDAPAGPKHARTTAPADALAGRTQLDIARAARDKAERILAEEPDISGAELADRCGMKERWGQTVKKQFAERVLGERAV